MTSYHWFSRAKGHPVLPVYPNDHGEKFFHQVGTPRCGVRTSQRDVPTLSVFSTRRGLPLRVRLKDQLSDAIVGPAEAI